MTGWGEPDLVVGGASFVIALRDALIPDDECEMGSLWDYGTDYSMTMHSTPGLELSYPNPSLKDLTGDGIGELVVAGADAQDGDVRRVYILSGPFSAASTSVPTADADQILEGSQVYEQGVGDAFGRALAFGDTDADGTLDLLVGAPDSSGGGWYAGAVTVFRAENSTLVSGAVVRGSTDQRAVGAHIAAGNYSDALGDEFAVLGSAEGPDTIYLYSGPLSGSHGLADASCSVAAEEDIRGLYAVFDQGTDGLDEVLVEAPDTYWLIPGLGL